MTPLRRPLRRRARLAAIAVGTSLALVAGPALAASVTVEDADEDAIEIYDAAAESGDYGIDLAQVKIDHTADAVVVTSSFDPIGLIDEEGNATAAPAEAYDDVWTYHYLYVDTNADGVADRVVDWVRGGRAEVYTFASERRVARVCTTFGTAEAYPTSLDDFHTTTMTIPRSCLGDPAAVAVHLDVIWQGTEQDRTVFQIDSAPGALGDATRALSPSVATEASVVVPSPAPAPAAAAPVASSVSVAASKRVQRFRTKKPIVLTVTPATAPSGVVGIFDGAKRLTVVFATAGQPITYRLPRRLKVGVHRLRIVFTPSDADAYEESVTRLKVRVKR